MQKIKKSLEINILKINLNKNSQPFLLENSNKNINKDFHKSKILTTSSLKSIETAVLTDNTSLKFPLTLKIFKTNRDLQVYFFNNSKHENFFSVLVNVQNFLYKKKTFNAVFKESMPAKLNNLKQSILPIILLLQVIKFNKLN